MKVTVLGCGTSAGVPVIGCRCAVCLSTTPRNRRRRCSIVVEHAGTRILIDTPPELREQCLDAGIDRIDAILYTHAHADHVNGIDDVRALNQIAGGSIDVHGDARVIGHIRERFGYAFHAPDPGRGWWRPSLRPMPFDGPFSAGALRIVPFEQVHGSAPSWGFRVGDFAYSTDLSDMTPGMERVLDGIRVWIVDALRETPHPSHAHLERTLGWIDRFRPERAILTHMNHEVDYDDWANRLPRGVEPAYDQMVIDV